jgi:hypothetical protein
MLMLRSIPIWLVLSAVFAADEGAPRRHPAEEKGIKSLESTIPAALKLVNRSKQTVKIYWIDYKGKRKLHATLQPGETFDSDTFVTHPWLVTDTKDNAWAIYFADAQPRTVEITESAGRQALPSSSYQRRKIEGFIVLIHPQVLAHAREAAAALEELTKQAKAITGVVPAGPLAEIRKVRIWLEWDSYGASAAQFHPRHATAWLRLRGENPDKAGSVDINNTRHFIDWSRRGQPWMLMHELAHAYHNLVLGASHAGIKAAYKQAVERKLYESVLHVDGSKRRAYALVNDQEYFAELTEAYFGRNDFFPFDRHDLQKHDPTGYRLLREIWGEPRQGVDMCQRLNPIELARLMCGGI